MPDSESADHIELVALERSRRRAGPRPQDLSYCRTTSLGGHLCYARGRYRHEEQRNYRLDRLPSGTFHGLGQMCLIEPVQQIKATQKVNHMHQGSHCVLRRTLCAVLHPVCVVQSSGRYVRTADLEARKDRQIYLQPCQSRRLQEFRYPLFGSNSKPVSGSTNTS